jgi:threonyl-tRNA synthetase
LQKVPFLLVVGDKEAEAGEVSVRVRGKGDEGKAKVDAFVTRIRRLIETRAPALD